VRIFKKVYYFFITRDKVIAHSHLEARARVSYCKKFHWGQFKKKLSNNLIIF